MWVPIESEDQYELLAVVRVSDTPLILEIGDDTQLDFSSSSSSAELVRAWRQATHALYLDGWKPVRQQMIYLP